MADEDELVELGELAEMLEFENASIDSLKGSPDVQSSEAAETYDYVVERKKAKVERLRADNGMRKAFFGWASKLAGWMIAGNFVIFAGYMVIGAVGLPTTSDAVMLAWISATVVEIIGVVAIIARYLFRDRAKTSIPG